MALIFSACVLLVSVARAQDAGQPPDSAPLAVFAGQSIDDSQFSPSAKRQLQNMEEQVFAVRHRALQVAIEQKLVDAEAKKKGVTVEQLFQSEVESKVQEPTDVQIAAYYDLHKSQINQPLDQARGNIVRELKAAALNTARDLYMQGLMEEALQAGQLTVLLHPPRLTLPIDPARLKGNPKAPVTIIEFSDFACAECGKADATVAQILAKYPDKVQVSFRDFPFERIRPGAVLSAEAARCAGEQNKFWEYHDLLFSHPSQQSRDNLVSYARTLKLDDKAFEGCLDSGKHESDVEQDFQLGSRAGVVTPPTFFINGRFLEGDEPLSAFEQIVDKELARQP